MGIKHTCSERYILLLRGYMLLLAVTALCAAVVMAVERFTAGAAVTTGIFVLFCAAAAALPMSSRKITYTRTRGCLRIDKGIAVRRTLIVNRSDIRYAEISRSLPERRLGLCTVTFFTGGGRIRLKGIHFDDGSRLQYLFGGEAAE